LEEGVE